MHRLEASHLVASALQRFDAGHRRAVGQGYRRLSVADDGAQTRHGAALTCQARRVGRNGYHAFIADVLDGQMVLCAREERESSRYRVGRAELRFEARAERHFPVAVASMVSKYVRELSMEAFNRFWQRHVPGVVPTKGYPADAKRFRRQIAAAQERLKIPDSVLWRER